jgi:hypothetical protein
MFGQIPEILNSEALYKSEQFRQEAHRDHLARQAKNRQPDENKRDRQAEVLQAVKLGRLSIEEGLNRLENV